MRLPAEPRLRLELALRAVAFAALAWLGWTVAARPGAGRRVQLAAHELAGALPRWTAAPPADSLVVRVDRMPAPALRDWLAALRAAGTAVSWSGAPRPLAVSADWSHDPAGVLRVRVAAPRGAALALADSLGELAAATAGAGGALFELPPGPSRLAASAGAAVATLAVPPRPPPRHVAVIGRAGWETKFVTAALEERGWPVDVRAAIAPGLTVGQGAPWPPDTARHAAAVVLDSVGASEAAALAAFVRRGGGLVLGPAAFRAPRLAAVLAARPAGRVRASRPAVAAADPRAALAFERLAPAAGAAVLERRNDDAAVAARRAGAGRVVQLGYDDTWRWRLTGGDEAPEAHRAYWAALVGAAAGELAAAAPAWSEADPAPLASLALGLGPAVAPGGGRAPGPGSRPAAAAFAVLLAVLLAEWTSRRLRGAA